MGIELVSILALVVTIEALIVYIDTLKESKSKSNIGKFTLALFIVSSGSVFLSCFVKDIPDISKLISCINKNISGIGIFILLCFICRIIIEIKLTKNKRSYESIIKLDKGYIKEYDHNKEQYGDNVDKYKETLKNYKVGLKACLKACNKKECNEILTKYKDALKACKKNKKVGKDFLDKYKDFLDKNKENIKSYKESIKNNIQKNRTIDIIFNKGLLSIGVVALTFKIITLIENKTTLSADIVTTITVIVAFITAAYTSMKSNKAHLSAESLWRKELMNVASKNEIGIDDLLRLRASQNYKYANKYIRDNKLEKYYMNTGDEVRDKIGNATNNLYNKYIFTKRKKVKISFEHKNIIRNLAVALLKYDYIKRGDNVKLTHYIIRELEEDNEYQNLLNWINKEIDVDKYII